MKNYILIIAAIALAATAGCKKDDDGDYGVNTFNRTITGQVVNGDPAIKKVEASIIGETIATGSYSNGGFTITLPERLNSSVCDKITESTFEGATFSDKNAMIAKIMTFDCYDGTGKFAGDLWYQTDETMESDFASFVYTDRNVTVNGKHLYYSTEYNNLILKKGWNIVYSKQTAQGKSVESNQEISGLKWYLDTWYVQ